MATDAGEVDEGEEIISCAGTYKGLDTALVVKTAYSMNFFKNFEIKDFRRLAPGTSFYCKALSKITNEEEI